jgi:multiple sugar transport system ATP-binding protein
MASVTFEHVTKRYRDVVAVRDLSLGIEDGGILMLVGPSGCGKTTALRLIAGLEVPDEGAVFIDERDMAGVPPSQRNIAMVFEGYALYPHMAVRDNLTFALRLQRLGSQEIDRRVSAVAEAMELDHLLRRRPPGLATGEAQHVAIGRAVMRDAPAVLLLDDALSHLDARQRLEARVEVGRLHRELGSTIVAVTHDQAEALAVGTSVAVMDSGLLQQLGAPQQLYEHPANTFVAGFIGSPPMNLIAMELQQHDGQAVLRSEGLEISLPRHHADLTEVVSPSITVGFRPEDVRLGVASTVGQAGFQGRCELAEYLGSDLLVHLRVGSHEVVAHDDPADDIGPGDIVDCSIALECVRLFDTGTGRALAVTPAVAAAGTGRP